MAENRYQAGLIRRIKRMFPGCMVIKNDTGYQQGLPDLTILWYKNWAVLEVKDSQTAPFQPNQEYFIKQLDEMSFSAAIYPENETEVLCALQEAFESPRRARIS